MSLKQVVLQKVALLLLPSSRFSSIRMSVTTCHSGHHYLKREKKPKNNTNVHNSNLSIRILARLITLGAFTTMIYVLAEMTDAVMTSEMMYRDERSFRSGSEFSYTKLILIRSQ